MERKDRVKMVEDEGDEAVVMPQKVNDIIAEAMAAKPLPPLFDGFWQTGETALMFGTAGVGKSLFSVRLADALARGRPIDGFDMPRRRHKVLYVDLLLSNVQFQRRYTATGGSDVNSRPYRFAERFHRGRPRYDEDLCDWVRKMVRLGGYEVIVIDDLSAVMRTDDGTFDTLRIMREMKRLSLDTGVSILVLADSLPSPRHDLSEADLRRSRVLCGFADSVFAIGHWGRGNLKLVQFRSQGSEVKWGTMNPIGCAIGRDANGVVTFIFDERFAPKLDPERCALICRANKLWGEGLKFREIGELMGMSKSHASRLFHAWTPAVHRLFYGTDPLTEADRYGGTVASGADGHENDNDLDGQCTDAYDNPEEYGSPSEAATADAATGENMSPYSRVTPEIIPFAAALRRRLITDLTRSFDGYGHEIFVESASEHSGKPTVWFKKDRQQNFTRYERSLTTILAKNLGRSGFVP